MTFIEPVSDDGASPEAAAVLAGDAQRLGYVPNFSRAFAHRPALYAAWQQLNGALRATMDARRYELVTLAAARRLRSSYCALAHGRILAEKLIDVPTTIAVARGEDADELDDVDRAVIALAERVVDDATSVGEADVARLRDLGLSDPEILDVVAAAAARCFFSKTLDALGVEPDGVYRALDDELVAALTVGRPIEA